MISLIKTWYARFRADGSGLPEYLLLGAVGLVVLSFVLFYLIDLRNVFGMRDFLFSGLQPYFYFFYAPFFFEQWGRNSGFAEVFQWAGLGAALVMAAFLAGRYFGIDRLRYKFFSLMAVAFLLMLLEDAGNIRHLFMSWVQVAANEPDQGIFGTLFEAGYFALLAGVPLYALVRYGWHLREHVRAATYILAGFFMYFLAGSLSFIGTAFSGLVDRDLYTFAGERLYAFALRIGDAEVAGMWAAWNEQHPMSSIGFSLLDSLIEENIELLGAAAFCAGMLVLVRMSVRSAVSPLADEKAERE